MDAGVTGQGAGQMKIAACRTRPNCTRYRFLQEARSTASSIAVDKDTESFGGSGGILNRDS